MITSDLLVRSEPSEPLRSSGTGRQSVPKVTTKDFYAPRISNKLPEKYRAAATFSSLHKRLFLASAKKNVMFLNSVLILIAVLWPIILSAILVGK